MKEKDDLELSNFFWNSYRLFLDEKLSLNELRMALTSADDVIFFKEKCDSECDVQKTIKAMMARELDVFTDELLTELKNIPTRAEKKTTMQKVLVVLLGFGGYLSKVGGEVKRACDEVMDYFFSPHLEPWNERFGIELHNYIISMACASNYVSEEEVVEPILCKMGLIYSCLATSDREGASKCKKMAKALFTNIWFKSMPELVTLNCLRKMEHGTLPVSEFKLLERYSF
jgi:hypothetical protein